MVKKGDNKGHAYEKKIFRILKEKQLLPPGTKKGAGSGPGTDTPFLHKKKQYKLEIKNSVTAPDYGQKRLVPKLDEDGKTWKWHWAKKEEITDYYTKKGVLKYLDGKKIIPNKYRKRDTALTLKDVKGDQKVFEDKTYTISNDAFVKFYEGKADYVQVGKGYGLFHIKEDKANLGTERFDGKFILRFRAKRHTTKNFHNYSFFAVLKCKEVLRRSRYNLEEDLNNEFPPIKP